MATKVQIIEEEKRFSYIHEKCGGTVWQKEGTDPVPADADCPICAEVREFARLTGQIRATMGTPLAEELGLRVFRGDVGMSVPQ